MHVRNIKHAAESELFLKRFRKKEYSLHEKVCESARVNKKNFKLPQS